MYIKLHFFGVEIGICHEIIYYDIVKVFNPLIL